MADSIAPRTALSAPDEFDENISELTTLAAGPYEFKKKPRKWPKGTHDHVARQEPPACARIVPLPRELAMERTALPRAVTLWLLVHVGVCDLVSGEASLSLCAKWPRNPNGAADGSIAARFRGLFIPIISRCSS